jgi:soluble lytic murein transglycosylase-like protein
MRWPIPISLRLNPRSLAKAAPLGVIGFTAAVLLSVTVPAVSAGFRKANSLFVPRPASSLSTVFHPRVQRWEPEILRWAGAYGLDPNLVATVMQIESCGDARAVSRSGAQGLFQVMPFHFEAGENMQDPETNARRGLPYLAESLLLSNGNVELALAGYNGGHGVIDWKRSAWPPETQRYAYWGAGIYADASEGRDSSPRLGEWLAAGGASLCGAAPA